jgi:hypothetical protein
MSLRAISFVRRKAAFRAGHVGWAFEYRSGLFNCGSVENDQGHPIAPVAQMDFWTCNTLDPLAHMRERHYDAFQVVDVASPRPQDAWQAVVWLSRQPYFVLGRNCLDDVYDVMRAYGVPDLPVPAHEILPDRWFELLPGDPQNLDDVESLPAHGWALLRERLPFNRDEQCDIPEAESAKPPPWRIHGTPHHEDLQQRLTAAHHGTPAKVHEEASR